MRALFLLLGCAIFHCQAALAGTPAVADFVLDTESWYPIPESQMESAVMDSALDALTDSGHLRLIQDPDNPKTGRLSGKLSLVGQASQISFTLELHTSNYPSSVATSSISVQGLDHGGIYNALNHIGAEVGARLSNRIEFNHRPERSFELEENLASLFNEARELRRDGDFDAAREKFHSLIITAENPDSEWVELAEDELNYGILIHEAQQIMISLNDMNMPSQVKMDNAILASNKARQALAYNHTNPERASTAQHWIDQMDMVIDALDRIMQHEVVTAAMPLRMALDEGRFMRGGCMDKDAVLEYMGPIPDKDKIRITDVTGPSDDRTYHIEHREHGKTVALHCSDQGVRVDF